MAIPKRRIIVDTDTAAEDCTALLLAVNADALDILAVTVVAGNVAMKHQVHNALGTLALSNRSDIPVHIGAKIPLAHAPATAAEVHSEDGVCGYQFPQVTQSHETEFAPSVLARLARQHPGEITIIAIGPLTNIWLACVIDPEFPSNLGALHIMGGTDNGMGNISPAAEFNFYVDPLAAKLVLAAGFRNVKLFTWTLNRQTIITPQLREEISSINTVFANFYLAANEACFEFDKQRGFAGQVATDSLLIVALLDPSVIEAESQAHVDVEAVSDLSRGYSFVDRRGVNNGGSPPNAVVVSKINFKKYVDVLLRTLKTR